jgi:hypothetical protein
LDGRTVGAAFGSSDQEDAGMLRFGNSENCTLGAA